MAFIFVNGAAFQPVLVPIVVLLSVTLPWILRIKGLFREAIQREAAETGEELKQKFCVILTIRDPKREAPVYNEIAQQLQEKGFIFYNVPIRSEVREHVRVQEDSDN